MKSKIIRFMIPLYLRFTSFFLIPFLISILEANFPVAISLLVIVFGINAYFLVMAILNIVNSIKFYRTGNYKIIRKRMMVIKFASIPYFIVNFILWAIIIMPAILIGPQFAIITVPFVLILLLVGVFDCVRCVAFTSVDGIVYALALKKQGRISGGKAVALIIPQFFFFADIIATLILAFKKKYRQDTDLHSIHNIVR